MLGAVGKLKCALMPLGLATSPGCASHPVRRQKGDCCGQEARRDWGHTFVQLESPGALVVSAQGVGECSVVQ